MGTYDNPLPLNPATAEDEHEDLLWHDPAQCDTCSNRAEANAAQ